MRLRGLFTALAMTTIASGPVWAAGSSLPPANGTGLPVIVDGSATTVDAALNNGVAGQQAQRLTHWRNALALVRNNVRDAYFCQVGDSTTAGYGSTGTTGAARRKSWPAQLATQLSAPGIPTSDNSFFGNGGNGLSGTDPRLTITGGFAASFPSFGASAYGTTTAGTLTWGPAGNIDTFDVYYIQTTAGSTFTEAIDGGSATTVTTTGALTVGKATITAGAPSTTHSLAVAWSSGSVQVLGVVARNSASKAVIFCNGGASGIPSSSINTPTNGYAYLAVLTKLAPDLTTISIGINDMPIIGTANHFANTQAAITAAKLSGDVILITPPPLQVTGSYTLVNQQQINADFYALAASNPGVPLLDLYRRWGKDWTVQNGLGWEFDSLHPNQVGYADWAAFVAPLVGNP